MNNLLPERSITYGKAPYIITIKVIDIGDNFEWHQLAPRLGMIRCQILERKFQPVYYWGHSIQSDFDKVAERIIRQSKGKYEIRSNRQGKKPRLAHANFEIKFRPKPEFRLLPRQLAEDCWRTYWQFQEIHASAIPEVKAN